MSLRWATGGFCLSMLALLVNLGIAYAPKDLVPTRPVQPSWQQSPDRPFVPPPARP